MNLTYELHTGGIKEIVSVTRKQLPKAIKQLTSCTKHNATHVFIVDQSRGDRVHLGVSIHGFACLKEVLEIQELL